MGVEERRAVPCGATVKTCLSKGIFVLTSRPIASILKGSIFMRGILLSLIRKSFTDTCFNCCFAYANAFQTAMHKIHFGGVKSVLILLTDGSKNMPTWVVKLKLNEEI